jgi:rfaE bifunctional protein nucleotidyltransferase chain/domain
MANSTGHKVIPFQELGEIKSRFPNDKIVHCHGVFDVLHAGHLKYFESAKKFGDKLIVTLTSDRYVNKGPGRPYFAETVRANMIAALEVIDFVTISDFPVAVNALEKLKPHFYVKGPDYRDMTKDVTGGIYAEEVAVEKGGGKLVFTEDEVFSSSTLVNRFFFKWSEDQERIIDQARALGGLDKIEEVMTRVEKLKVTVIGEPIVDTYVFCNPESISSKSPSISARYLYQENYAGGSLAIANHLSDFVNQVKLVFTHGGETYFQQMLKEKIDPRIKVRDQVIPNIPTPRKTRYIAVDKAQRIFELTDIRSDQWLNADCGSFLKILAEETSKPDLNVLCDFGHGLFEGDVLGSCGNIKGFVALNSQTNSSNFGFNPFTRHKRFDFLSIDTREARLAYHDRFTSPADLFQKICSDLRPINKAKVAMTLGPNGSYYHPNVDTNYCFSPAFADSVIDATGAGDAFYALTSVLIKADCPPELVSFLSNIFAGLKTKIIGNKSSVSKAQFMKAVNSILK